MVRDENKFRVSLSPGFKREIWRQFREISLAILLPTINWILSICGRQTGGSIQLIYYQMEIFMKQILKRFEGGFEGDSMGELKG